MIATLPLPASPERAWRVWSRVEDWPRWDPFGSASAQWLSGEPWTEGARLRVGHRPGAFDCVVVAARPPAEVAWLGRAAGIEGRHAVGFLPHPRGCVMRMAETFEGRGARALRPVIRLAWGRQMRGFRRHLAAQG